MNHTIKFLLLLTATVSMGSCKKFLDEKQRSALTLVNTAQDCQLLLDNYDLNTKYPNDGEASADDYYLSEGSYNNLGEEDRKIYGWVADSRRQSATQQWQYTYRNIYDLNLVLEGLDGKAKGTADATTMNTLRGSALLMRAFAYYQIAQIYAKPYDKATASTDPGIPLITEADINVKSARGTLEQTYAKITGDLKEAAELLPNTSKVVTRPTKAAAYAMLARVYLAMRDYTSAGTAANSALQIKSALLDLNTVSTSSPTPFGPQFSNPEIIFQAVSIGTDYAPPSYGPVGATTDPQVALIDPALISSYDASDLRLQIFFKPNQTTPGAYKFTGNYDAGTSNAFFIGPGTDEMYLVRAECSARAGNANNAMADLNTLLRTRWITGAYTDMTATSADDALVKVLTERRKELVFRNVRWSDLRRLNMETRFQKTLTRTAGAQTFTLPPNDPRYVLLIPGDVITYSTLTQNPR